MTKKVKKPQPPNPEMYTHKAIEWVYEGPHRNVYREGDGDFPNPIRPGSLDYKLCPSKGLR